MWNGAAIQECGEKVFVKSAAYSFTVPAGAQFVVVVNTTGTITASSEFSGTVSGFVDDTPGSGPCPTP